MENINQPIESYLSQSLDDEVSTPDALSYSMDDLPNTLNSDVSRMTLKQCNDQVLKKLKSLDLRIYLFERYAYEFDEWQTSILEWIGLEFVEKKETIDKIFISKYAGADWSDYYEAIADMIDSWARFQALMEFQEEYLSQKK